jgi:TRAP-type mannitol/chloroaromatic compound transport system substrate-binding protein
MEPKEENMKRNLLVGAVILTVLSWMMMAFPLFAVEPVVTWKVQIAWPTGMWPYKSAQIWAEDVFKMSGGRMKIDLTSPDQIEGMFEIFSLVQRGILDGGHTSPAFVIQKYPATVLFAASPAFFDLPGYYTWMYAHGGKELLQETYGNALRVFPAGMGWANSGGWANKKFETLSDFKGQKYGTTRLIWGRILSEAGASVERVMGFEVPSHLDSGTLDAGDFSTPWHDMKFGFHKIAKFCYFPGMQQAGGVLDLLINNEKWDALPPDLKEIVKGACDASMARSLTHWLLDEAKAVKMIKDQGKVTVVKYSKEMQQEILDKFVAQYDAVKEPMFQKVWDSQKEFMKIYVPYMKLQQVEAEVKLK